MSHQVAPRLWRGYFQQREPRSHADASLAPQALPAALAGSPASRSCCPRLPPAHPRGHGTSRNWALTLNSGPATPCSCARRLRSAMPPKRCAMALGMMPCSSSAIATSKPVPIVYVFPAPVCVGKDGRRVAPSTLGAPASPGPRLRPPHLPPSPGPCPAWSQSRSQQRSSTLGPQTKPQLRLSCSEGGSVSHQTGSPGQQWLWVGGGSLPARRPALWHCSPRSSPPRACSRR